MTVLHRIRRRSNRWSRLCAGLFVPVWLSIVAAPCAMAMQLGQAPEHDCPHCPPAPCHEVAPDDCQQPDSLDGLRAGDLSQQAALAPPATAATAGFGETARPAASAPALLPPARAGPRPHLLHAQFNE